ncbi:MAG: hypothetical protein KatS3mg068_0144 [Candidatus Sericytochromatia bacterium]|nr:MAG: hypothetical protein KatS3mg068_0144 [Candidatus Sericytochromatia bacterium]
MNNISKYITYKYAIAVLITILVFLVNVSVSFKYISYNNNLINSLENISHQRTLISKLSVYINLYLSENISKQEFFKEYDILYSSYESLVKEYKLDESINYEINNLFYSTKKLLNNDTVYLNLELKKIFISSKSLIDKLEILLLSLEKDYNRNNRNFINFLIISFFMLIITLVLQILFIFKPMEKQISKFSLDLESKNQELEIKSSELEFSIERLKDLQNNLEEDNAKINAILEGANASIWLIDKDYNIIYYNSIFKKNFSSYFGKEVYLGFNIKNILENNFKQWKEYYQKALNGEQLITEEKTFFEGKYYYTEVIFTPVKSGDEIIGVAVYSKDITDKKIAEQEIIKAKEEAENSAKAKSDFSGYHES